MSLKEKVHKMIKKVKLTKATTWETFQKHSMSYSKMLNLSVEDLAVIEEEIQERSSSFPDIAETGEKGFLKFNVDDEKFSLAVKRVCGVHYGGRWQCYIFAICTSSPGLNQTVGEGTTTISIVSEEWNEKILHHLRSDEKKPQLTLMLTAPSVN